METTDGIGNKETKIELDKSDNWADAKLLENNSVVSLIVPFLSLIFDSRKFCGR